MSELDQNLITLRHKVDLSMERRLIRQSKSSESDASAQSALVADAALDRPAFPLPSMHEELVAPIKVETVQRFPFDDPVDSGEPKVGDAGRSNLVLSSINEQQPEPLKFEKELPQSNRNPSINRAVSPTQIVPADMPGKRSIFWRFLARLGYK